LKIFQSTLYYYHWVDISVDGLLVISPVVSVSALT
jgi:hypothetical protein